MSNQQQKVKYIYFLKFNFILILYVRWQQLKPWHTIPRGIETRLPVGSGARKEARIPNPFRVQLTLPTPCNFFVRLDLYRNTKIEEIKLAASTQCKAISPECFLLTGDGTIIPDNETVESSLLFYRSIGLQIKPGSECAAAVLSENP